MRVVVEGTVYYRQFIPSPLTTYGIRIEGEWNGYFSGKSPTLYVTTLDSPRPDNWVWEYTIASGQSFTIK